MKRITSIITGSLIIISLALIACHSPAGISGKISQTGDKELTVYLIQPDGLWDVAASYFGEVIDSAEVKTDGSFEFEHLPATSEPVLLEIALGIPGKEPNYLQSGSADTSNFFPLVWQTGETLHITAKADAFQQSFSLQQPSAINKALLRLRDINQKAYQRYLAGKSWNVKDGMELMAKEKARLEYQRELMDFADSTNYFIPAMVALRCVSPESDYERVPEFLVRQSEKWQRTHPDHPWLKKLQRASNPGSLPVLIGDVFPDPVIPLLSKDTLFLHDTLGKKLTIIDLWASWCAPCRLENREALGPLWEKYHKQGLQIVAYGLESDERSWREAAVRDEADRWVQASDLQGDDAYFMQRIRVETIPANFILDENGKVLAKNVHGEALMDTVRYFMDTE
jgi:thiol-disulfide isomerase/thioredoxin